MDAWTVLAQIANVVTIFAALIAFFGLLSTWLTRPRIKVTADAWDPNSARINVWHSKGLSPARNFFLGQFTLGEDDIALAGEDMPWVSTLIPGDSRFISIYDTDEVVHSGKRNKRETRIRIEKPFGFIMGVSWQRPILRWLRTRQVVLWSQEERANGKTPVVLKGRKAARIYKAATTRPD